MVDNLKPEDIKLDESTKYSLFSSMIAKISLFFRKYMGSIEDL
jgi:hypothetical protein